MALTNSALAEKLSTLIGNYRRRLEEFQEWLTGTVGGGSGGDGVYPLRDLSGNIINVKCPAQLEDDVTNVVNSATTKADEAEAARVAAVAAQAAAELAQTTAATKVTEAQAEKNLAESARADAQSAAATAIGSRTITESDSAPTGTPVAGSIHLERTESTGWQTCIVHVYVESP